MSYIFRTSLLSAKKLKPTMPEQMGFVEREKLCDFYGRSRKPQMALAKELGLTEYPMPAGGCLLTDPIYSYHLKELFAYNPNPSLKDINLLRLGRHFRISDECRIIVGRDENENNTIQSLAENDDYLLWVDGFGSPLTIVCANVDGNPTDDDLKLAASICARYSDAKHLPSVNVSVYIRDTSFNIEVSPATKGLLDYYRIQKENRAKAAFCPLNEG